MSDIELRVKKLLPHQQFIRDNASRYNVLALGRRCGKTSMIEDLSLDPENNMGRGCWDGGSNGAFSGHKIAIFSPTYKSLGELWRELTANFRLLASHIDKVEKRIEIKGGGVIDFWSLDNIDSVRGRKYRRIIVDEAAMIRNLEDAWTASIRPLLIDFRGDAWFLSTPKKGVYFEALFNRGVNGDRWWQSFRMPTSANPLIDAAEIEEARNSMLPHIFAQEILAQFVTDDLTTWLYSFDNEKHVEGGDLYKPSYPIYVFADFNNDPFEATLWQVSPNKGGSDSFIHCIDMFSGRYKVDELGRLIKSKYPRNILFLGGDRSGQNEDLGRNMTLYQIFGASLGIGRRQLLLNKTNLTHADSRILCNTVIQNYPRFRVSGKNCGKLIEQIGLAVVDEDSSTPGKLRKDRGIYKLDAFDSMRYMFQTLFLDYAKKVYFRTLGEVVHS